MSPADVTESRAGGWHGGRGRRLDRSLTEGIASMSRHEDLDAVLQPLGHAHGLPNRHYIDPETFGLERQRLFFDGWAGLGFASDVPAAGDARPVDFLGVPLVMIRDRAGVLRVFQNTCRHRGMILIDAPRRIEGAVRCPYHSWCYALDGALKATPHVGGPGHNVAEGIDRAELGLFEIASAVWRDIVFVNLAGNAPPFAEHVAAIAARWPFDGPFVPGDATSRFALDVGCNWKLAVENYCESYHLPWVHPGLNAYSRLEDHYDIIVSGASGQGTRVYRPTLDAGGRRFPDWPGITGPWLDGAEYLALYPNVLLGQHRDHAFAILLEPQGPEHSVEHVAIHYAAPLGVEHEALQAANAAMWRTVFEEDIFVVEGMQRGRHGPHFDGGRFSPAMDGATHAFHAWVAGRMSVGR